MFTSVLTCKKLLINKNYPPGKFLITHPFKILEKKKLKILRYIFAHLWKIFYWWYFIVPIFCRLITKIVTLKKEVNELRKQQLLQSSDERYCIRFHWLPFLRTKANERLHWTLSDQKFVHQHLTMLTPMLTFSTLDLSLLHVV